MPPFYLKAPNPPLMWRVYKPEPLKEVDYKYDDLILELKRTIQRFSIDQEEIELIRPDEWVNFRPSPHVINDGVHPEKDSAFVPVTWGVQPYYSYTAPVKLEIEIKSKYLYRFSNRPFLGFRLNKFCKKGYNSNYLKQV